MARRSPRVAAVATLAAAAGLATGPAAAHVGTLEGATAESPIPTWFVVLVAGVVVGASFLFTSLMADHAALRWVNGLGLRAGLSRRLRDGLASVLGAASVLGLAAVVAVGLFGPPAANDNAASLFVWVAWWGGFTITTYAVGNAWPLVDPFRRLAGLVPGDGRRAYPEDLGAWPAVVGVLALVFLEVVSSATERPRVLAVLVVGYAALAVGGAAIFGAGSWFANADPLAALFRTYGSLAPLQRTEDGLAVRLPGAALTDGDVFRRPGMVAFVLALLWATTFDGFVSTPAWTAAVTPLAELGVPAVLLYVLALAGGFAGFYLTYRLATRRARDSAGTYVTAAAIARWLAPSLVPIAAGYHLAHFLGFVVALAPTLFAALQAPIAGPAGLGYTVLGLPDWFGFLKLGFVLGGHLLAIWVAHSIAFDLFPGARQPIRSQYPLIAVMIAYTLVSAWVVVSPTVPTPYT